MGGVRRRAWKGKRIERTCSRRRACLQPSVPRSSLLLLVFFPSSSRADSILSGPEERASLSSPHTRDPLPPFPLPSALPHARSGNRTNGQRRRRREREREMDQPTQTRSEPISDHTDPSLSLSLFLSPSSPPSLDPSPVFLKSIRYEVPNGSGDRKREEREEGLGGNAAVL